MAVAEKVGFDRRGNELYKRHPNGDVVMEATVERERIRINGKDEIRELKRSRPVIDNDLPVIAEKYREFRAKYPMPGVDPRAASTGGPA
jgi:type I restriction enzyme M protein